MATLYYHHEDWGAQDWEDVGNWYTDAAHTTGAGRTPATGDAVQLDAEAFIGTGTTVDVDSLTGPGGLYGVGGTIGGGIFSDAFVMADELTVTGGTFAASVTFFLSGGMGFHVEGGTFDCGIAIEVPYADLNGGAFNADVAMVDPGYYGYWVVNGGTFNGEFDFVGNGQMMELMGGTFNGHVHLEPTSFASNYSGIYGGTFNGDVVVVSGALFGNCQFHGSVTFAADMSGELRIDAYGAAALATCPQARFTHIGPWLYRNRGINGSSILGMA